MISKIDVTLSVFRWEQSKNIRIENIENVITQLMSRLNLNMQPGDALDKQVAEMISASLPSPQPNKPIDLTEEDNGSGKASDFSGMSPEQIFNSIFN